MFKWLYSIGLALIALIWFPKLFQKKYRPTLTARLGWHRPSLTSDRTPRIWVHAVSLGETKAVLPLLRRLKEKRPESFIVFSSLTTTGLHEAQKGFPEADRHLYLPLDLFVRPLMKEMKPTLLLLAETDYWIHFLDEAKRNGAKIVLVNGKLSAQSLRLYKWLPGFGATLNHLIDRFLVQGELYKNRFIELGINPAHIEVCGNLKVDAEEGVVVQTAQEAPVLVIGSTHDPEEKLLLEALEPVWKRFPTLQVYLVPRHPERFDKVAKLIEELKIPFARFSSGKKAGLILVDAMGQLKDLYRKSDLCLVAGSWTSKVGGHNILEPALYGKPVIFGPYMQAQPDFCELVLCSKAGLQVPAEKLSLTLIHLLEHPEEAKQLGEAGLDLIRKNRGAMDKTLELILPLC